MQLPVVIQSSLGNRVIDHAGRFVAELPPGDTLSAQAVTRHLTSFIAESGLQSTVHHFRTSIQVHYEALFLDDIDRALGVLVCALGQGRSRTHLRVTSPSPDIHWDHVVSKFTQIRTQFPDGGLLRLELQAPIRAIEDEVLESLYSAGVMLTYLAGWSPHDASHFLDLDVVQQIASSGFRAVVNFYVTNQGIPQLTEALLDDTLLANYSAGLAIPLVSSHPYFKFAGSGCELPGSVQYCQLLTDCYQRYPHCDDVFEPLRELVARIANGSYDETFRILRQVNLLVDGDGGVSYYRTTPSLGEQCTNVVQLLAWSVSEVHEALEAWLVAHATSYNEFCAPCKWQPICGGVDNGVPDLPVPSQNLETLCHHRLLFLEHFAFRRPANFCLVPSAANDLLDIASTT